MCPSTPFLVYDIIIMVAMLVVCSLLSLACVAAMPINRLRTYDRQASDLDSQVCVRLEAGLIDPKSADKLGSDLNAVRVKTGELLYVYERGTRFRAMFRPLLLGHARAEITEISNEIDRLRCVLYADLTKA
ncbi:hypothetical protein C2E23DRAFT_832621 [Lenzites betulinus]|nr:hypothetical protein C2E23DRAFT_832621 [Lenzites betulinus]